jgi:hypothetical protein
MTMIQAKCEAVASMMNSHGAKIGEEVRFYVDGVCVDTRRLHKPEEYGTFVEGETYEIDAKLPPPPAVESTPVLDESVDGD